MWNTLAESPVASTVEVITRKKSNKSKKVKFSKDTAVNIMNSADKMFSYLGNALTDVGKTCPRITNKY